VNSSSRGQRRSLLPAAAVGATLAASYAAAVVPQTMLLVTSALMAVVLTVAPAGIFIGVTLVARDLADAVADRAIVGTLNMGALLGVLVVAVVLVRVVGMRRPIGLGAALFAWLLLLFWFTVGYTNFGNDPSLQRELIRASSIVALALFAANSVRTQRSVEQTVDIVIAASLLPAVVAIFQMAGGVERAHGTLAHANSAAGIFVIGLALSLWRVIDGRHPRAPGVRLYLAAALVFAVALLATRSLGGMAQAAATLLAYTLLTRRSGLSRAVAALAAIVLVAIFTLTPLGGNRVEALSTTTSLTQAAEGNTTNSLDWRFGHWAELIGLWRDKPILGYGSGATTSLVLPQGHTPHSDAIRLLVETGIVGVVIFGSACLVFFLRLFRVARAAPPLGSYGTVVLAIVIGAAIHALAENVWGETAILYALAVLVGSALGAGASPASAPASARTRRVAAAAR
jgi:O-antigen ligase